MARHRAQRRAKYRVAFKLDLEWDADLVEWLQAIPQGQRSQAIRQMLRTGLRPAQPENIPVNLDEFRAVVAEELTRVLAGRSVADEAVTIAQEDIEARYGAKLDRMLGGLHSGHDDEE